jgi:hypothetical protein
MKEIMLKMILLTTIIKDIQVGDKTIVLLLLIMLIMVSTTGVGILLIITITTGIVDGAFGDIMIIFGTDLIITVIITTVGLIIIHTDTAIIETLIIMMVITAITEIMCIAEEVYHTVLVDEAAYQQIMIQIYPIEPDIQEILPTVHLEEAL